MDRLKHVSMSEFEYGPEWLRMGLAASLSL